VIYLTETENVKKILRWGNGLAVFVTKECRKLGWKEGDYIKTEVNKENNSLTVKKVKL